MVTRELAIAGALLLLYRLHGSYFITAFLAALFMALDDWVFHGRTIDNVGDFTVWRNLLLHDICVLLLMALVIWLAA